MPPTIAQLALLGVAVAMFLVGGIISLARVWVEHSARLLQPAGAMGAIRLDEPESSSSLRLWAKVCMYCGVCGALAVLLWHVAMRGQGRPGDQGGFTNFDMLVTLGLLLAAFVMYVQRVKPIGGLDWFVMPIVIVLLAAAGFFGRTDVREYRSIGKDALLCVHWVTAYGAAAAFAIAAAGGAMYIISRRRLRLKTPGGVQFTSLERLDRIMMNAVVLGFALLTVGAITGFVRMFQEHAKLSHLKIGMAVLAWLAYAVAMHAPFNPKFRGRRAAMLTLLGFALVVGVLIVVQYMPGEVR